MKNETQGIKTLSFRLSEKEYRDLRKIGFYQEISLSDLIREGVALVVKKYKKTTIKSD